MYTEISLYFASFTSHIYFLNIHFSSFFLSHPSSFLHLKPLPLTPHFSTNSLRKWTPSHTYTIWFYTPILYTLTRHKIHHHPPHTHTDTHTNTDSFWARTSQAITRIPHELSCHHFSLQTLAYRLHRKTLHIFQTNAQKRYSRFEQGFSPAYNTYKMYMYTCRTHTYTATICGHKYFHTRTHIHIRIILPKTLKYTHVHALTT